MKRNPKHVVWRTKFGVFIRRRTVSGTLTYLAASGIPVTRFAIYNWVHAYYKPHFDAAVALCRMSRGRLTVFDIARHMELVQRSREGATECSSSL